MPSLSKLIAWSAVAVAACVSAVPGPQAENPLDARDINIIINTHDESPSSPFAVSCDPKACFIGCEDAGAIGGVCSDSECQCAYGSSRLTVQKGLAKGSRLAPVTDETCDLDICNAVCYQKGGFVGGICDANDSCQCVPPAELDKPSFKAKYCYADKYGRPICENNNCTKWTDCDQCYFVSRCCQNGQCLCGKSGLDNCGT